MEIKNRGNECHAAVSIINTGSTEARIFIGFSIKPYEYSGWVDNSVGGEWFETKYGSQYYKDAGTFRPGESKSVESARAVVPEGCQDGNMTGFVAIRYFDEAVQDFVSLDEKIDSEAYYVQSEEKTHTAELISTTWR